MKRRITKPTFFIFVIGLFFLMSQHLPAQKQEAKNNVFDKLKKGIVEQKDSVSFMTNKNVEIADTSIQILPDFYKRMEEKATSKIGKGIYNIIIRPPSSSDNLLIEQDYKQFEGKIIERIDIIVLDPFGTDISNPFYIPSKGIDKIFNDANVKTRKFIVRNNLQFKEGEKVNPVIVAETETYLRKLGYINDARIWIEEIALIDRVIVHVIVRDSWTLGLEVTNWTGTTLDMNIYDKNIMGVGNRIELDLINEKEYSQQWGYGFDYLYRNPFRSFTNFQVAYLDDIRERRFYASIERPLQPTLDYFGQISFDNLFERPDVVGWDSISADRNKVFSVSLGRAFTLSTKDAVKRLAFAGRYFEQIPEYEAITLPEGFLVPYKYAKSRSFLFQASLYKQAYYREHLIHSFGVTEDIAHGYNLSFQVGYNQLPQYRDGFYSSFSASAGRKFKAGNFYVSGAVSSHFNKDEMYEGVLKLSSEYFSPLQKWGKFRFRHFVNVDYTKVLNPVSVFNNSIYFTELTNLRTSASFRDAPGTERLIINIENDMFSPINLVGFKFMFYTFFDFGWIGYKNLFSSNNYTNGIGFGIRIRNDMLVIRTLELKIGFYPSLNQTTFNDYFDFKFSYPKASPNFVPTYPEEIPLR